MTSIEKLINGLTDKDETYSYNCLRKLEALSEQSNEVYKYFDVFAEMFNSSNWYVRIKGFQLIAAIAKWDEDNKIDEMIDEYLECISDPKPIIARQCISALPNLAKHKPELRNEIINALYHVDASMYAESMRALVHKDVSAALTKITSEK